MAGGVSRGLRSSLAQLMAVALVALAPEASSADRASPGTQPAVVQVEAKPPGPGVLMTPSSAPREHHNRSGLPWSSGVTPVAGLAREAERFGRKRGAPIDNVVVFPARQTWDNMLSTFWYQALPTSFDPARDDLVVTIPLWPSDSSVRATGTRQQWQTLGAHVAAVDPDAYLRLGWEMNIAKAPWALSERNSEAWIKAFRRNVRLMQDTCPSCRVVWNPNRGRDQTDFSSRRAFVQVKGLVDVYAIDDYDIFPPILDAQSEREHMESYGQLDESWRFARKHGKRFAVPEWGIACNGPGCQWQGSAGGDNPRFIRAFVAWFRAHARTLAFESYFDQPQRKTRSSLYTRPIGPRAGRAYRQELDRSLRAQP